MCQPSERQNGFPMIAGGLPEQGSRACNQWGAKGIRWNGYTRTYTNAGIRLGRANRAFALQKLGLPMTHNWLRMQCALMYGLPTLQACWTSSSGSHILRYCSSGASSGTCKKQYLTVQNKINTFCSAFTPLYTLNNLCHFNYTLVLCVSKFILHSGMFVLGCHVLN